ncbi:MAG: OmpH family outer membrane protein [Burkholderiaceae bacterium]|jgi:outer membrane protein
MMKPSIRILLIICLCALMGAGIQEVIAQINVPRAPKIGYVDADRILRESTAAKLARTKIETDFAPRQREIEAFIAKNQQLSEAFDRDAPTLPEAERARRQMDLLNEERKVQRLQRSYSDDFNERRNQDLGILQDNANKAIRKIAQTENYDLIVQEATYFNPRIDITDKVIAELGSASK